ncbi:hypothetical protein [Gordonia westfalica]|uniref:Uncharacterized protein n=1 Tax=Gordonia westfalica TaxID=158898 RepID=A0A1H2L8U6_9ACTN|nr:hypothetical protein [Gordonia westfalica]SDU77254.1 hypothetical protein SAMN04488548_1355 [Gordonia westfalica]
MAITHFIPELWAANITQAWDAEKVFAALLDRQYEGVATKGNTVHIPVSSHPRSRTTRPTTAPRRLTPSPTPASTS